MKEIYDLGALADDVIAKLIAAGADKASCSIGYSETDEFNYASGDFSLFRTLFGSSLGLTAIKGGKRGSARINRLDPESVDGAVAECLASADASEADPAWDIAPVTENGTFTEGTLEPDVELLFKRTTEFVSDVAEKYPKIIIEELVTAYETSHSVYANSNGVRYDTREGHYFFEPTYSAHDGDEATSFFYSFVMSAGLDKPFIETGSVDRDLSDTEHQLGSQPLDGKYTGTVILPPACLSDFLGSIVNNFVSDTTVLDGTSAWLGKLGTTVADSRLTLTMSVDDERLATHDPYTSEGFRSESFSLIENGVLKRFMLSLYVSNKTGFERAPNDGGSFVIEAGDTSLTDIIASVDRGLIVGRFSGGAPATNGDFSGVAKNGFFIENGKITTAATETMISGNLADMLLNIRAISRETSCDGASYLPYIAFDGITVSGKS